tara:strand:- start:9874 stop:10551 length:678 start_codon:yes stop_codon:yes gene_type:complete
MNKARHLDLIQYHVDVEGPDPGYCACFRRAPASSYGLVIDPGHYPIAYNTEPVDPSQLYVLDMAGSKAPACLEGLIDVETGAPLTKGLRFLPLSCVVAKASEANVDVALLRLVETPVEKGEHESDVEFKRRMLLLDAAFHVALTSADKGSSTKNLLKHIWTTCSVEKPLKSLQDPIFFDPDRQARKCSVKRVAEARGALPPVRTALDITEIENIAQSVVDFALQN